jgi:predicted helicase
MITETKSGRSRYDELHDKYHTIPTTKAGTRYERLAAMVFNALEERNVVIHDLKLSGDDPDVKHQIDVTIEIEGVKKTCIIECKDFDLAENKVGLGIIRNFRSVLEDTKADEGIVITCTGFTEDARKYAKSKGIKLAVLRVVETRDLNGYITTILVGFVIQQPANPRATVSIPENVSQNYFEQLAAIGVKEGTRNTDPVFFVREGESH